MNINGIKAYMKEMDSIKKEIYNISGIGYSLPRIEDAIIYFWMWARYAVKIIFLEKGLITFSLLQLLCIIIGYYLWVHIIGWIPEEIWESAVDSDKIFIAVAIILILWSFVCIGVIAFSTVILSACIGVFHILHKIGKKPTMAACLKIVLPNAWSLWIFSWIDVFWSVKGFFHRLPGGEDDRSEPEIAYDIVLYYAWKIGTIGISPALVTGRGLSDAGKHSINIVKYKLKDVAALRLGQSVLCWIVGILAFIGSIFFFTIFPDLVKWEQGVASEMFRIHFWLGVPLIISVGVVILFLRPVYVISSFDMYSDYLKEKDEEVILVPVTKASEMPIVPTSKGLRVIFVLFIICLILFVVFLFRYELGIMDMLSTQNGWEHIPK